MAPVSTGETILVYTLTPLPLHWCCISALLYTWVLNWLEAGERVELLLFSFRALEVCVIIYRQSKLPPNTKHVAGARNFYQEFTEILILLCPCSLTHKVREVPPRWRHVSGIRKH